MILELFHDVLINSSMFYVYFGMILVTIGIGQLLLLQYHSFQGRKYVQTDQINIHLLKVHEEQYFVFNEPFMIWFGKSCKRMFTTDDDLEDDYSSYFNVKRKIRGGKIWTKTSFAPPFKHIALSF